MKVRDIMKPARWTIGPDDSLARAERIVTRRRLHELLVVESGVIVGLLAERDILDARAGAADEEWWRVPVRLVMQAVPATADPDDALATAIDRLAESPADVLPVIEQGILIGQITATDLFEAERIPNERTPHPLTAADAMTEPAVYVHPDDSLVEAAKLMVDHQVRHLPVVDDGAVVGMLSDRDIRTLAGDPVRYLEAGRGDATRLLDVRDAMTPMPVTIRANRPLREVANALADEKIGALPIVDADGKLLGIVSYVDALRALAA